MNAILKLKKYSTIHINVEKIDSSTIPIINLYLPTLEKNMSEGNLVFAKGVARNAGNKLMSINSPSASVATGILFAVVIDGYLKINFGLDAIKTAEEATEIILAKDKIIGPEIVQQLFQPIINYYYSQCQRSEAMSVANKAADLILKYIN